MKKIILVLSMSLIVSSAFSTVTLTESSKSGTTVTIGYSYNGSGGFPSTFGLVLQATGGTITSVTATKTDGLSTSNSKGFGIFPCTISIDNGDATSYGTPVEPNGLPGGPSDLGTSRVVVSLSAIYADASGKPDNSGPLFTVVCSSGTTGLSAAAISEDVFREGVVDVNGVEIDVAPLTVVFPPVFVAAGAAAYSTATIIPSLPAGIAAGDVLLLFVETSNQNVSIRSQNGGTWAQVARSPQGTTGTRLTAFWSRYNGTQGAPTVSDSGDHQIGRIIAIRGAATSGDPCNITAGGVEAVTDTTGSIPGATTTVDNCLIVTAIATSLPDYNYDNDRFSNWTNADLTNLSERVDCSRNVGNGGGLGIATGIKAEAGAYGNTAVTLTISAYKGMMSIAIKP